MNKNDAVSIAPHLHKVTFENDNVRVLEVIVNPGDRAEMHTHPDNVIVVIDGGTLTMTNPNMEAKEVILKSGDAFFSSQNEHMVENKDSQTVKVFQIELKKFE